MRCEKWEPKNSMKLMTTSGIQRPSKLEIALQIPAISQGKQRTRPLGNWHRHSVATPESLTQDVRPQQALNEDVGEEFPIFQNGGAKK
jgi:hypothetical protein